MAVMATLSDKRRIETEMPYAKRGMDRTMLQFLCDTAGKFPDRPAVTFQMLSGASSPAHTYTWSELLGRVRQAANCFRDLGVAESGAVALLLPNSPETAVALLGGAIAGVVCPISPMLDSEEIAALLRESGARVLVTLKPLPKSDIAQKAARAASLAPGVETILEVDLLRHLAPPKSWIARLARPKLAVERKARVLDFNAELDSRPRDRLEFPDSGGDRVAACFHTAGATGAPKLGRHRYSGMLYNGWFPTELLLTEKDVVICPLPLFHSFAACTVFMSVISSGGRLVLPTPAGYLGDGVIENFWRLVERWKATFMVTVPTAVSALMQREVNADVSSLNIALCGSAPLPKALFDEFERRTKVKILEGYGLTEATGMVSCNPYHGERKIGSVGIPIPYTDVRVFSFEGGRERERPAGEIGEICVRNPGVSADGAYMDSSRNANLYTRGKYLRTGDLGRIDEDGYIWITGRTRDTILSGGRSVDPAVVEEALARHEAVAFVRAVGQPDRLLGEAPCAYVRLVEGARATEAELLEHAREAIAEEGAAPVYVGVMERLPKSAVGKVLKPELRKMAIERVFSEALREGGLEAEVAEVREEGELGLVAHVRRSEGVSGQDVDRCLSGFATRWTSFGGNAAPGS